MGTRSKDRAFTLVEIIVVIAIVMVLAVALWLVMGPPAKRSAHETRIKTDLRQVVGAIHLYMADNDDGYPHFLHTLSEAGYAYPAGAPELKDMPGAVGPPEYMLMYNFVSRLVEKRRKLITRFDPQQDAIVKALFYPKDIGEGSPLHFAGPDAGFVPAFKPTTQYRVLGASLDGRVFWAPLLNPWEDEYAYYALTVVVEEHHEHHRQRPRQQTSP